MERSDEARSWQFHDKEELMDWHQVKRSLDNICWSSRDPSNLEVDEISVKSLAAYIHGDPTQFEAFLLQELPEQVLTMEYLPDLVQRAVVINRLWPASDLESHSVVLGIAQGLIRAERTRRELKLSSWGLPHGWNPHDLYISGLTQKGYQIATLWHILGVLAVLPRDYEVERAEWLRRLDESINEHPDGWILSLGWILTVGPFLDHLDVAMTLKLMDLHPEIIDSLQNVANASPSRMTLRAQGIKAIAAGTDPARGQEWLLDAAATLLDRRRHQFPRPLEAPSATWLSDLDVESMLRGASCRALEEFADVVEAEGAAEEEGLTQNLLSLLVTNMKSVDRALHLAAPAGSRPRIEVERRTVPKNEENGLGADLGIVVNITLPSHAEIRFGDLIQVKKTQLLHGSGQVSSARADSWRIDIAQLEDLLHCSATAVYWLIAQVGNVYVVPAKMLLALRNGRSAPKAGTFTARYRDIRHVAIPLGSYLCDVLIGMWTASTNPETLAIADGRNNNSRTHPRNLLSITVQITDQ
ncbi:hypothetical protein [Nonomuraea sp. NPDC048901]|uniref:hypothetical protein n=1 Tax=Nonomuraea sp. NPDC048901 TaxID=3155627 RepID=UPI0033FCB7D4